MLAKERLPVLIVGAGGAGSSNRRQGFVAWQGTLPVNPERRPGQVLSSILGPPASEPLRPASKTDAMPSDTAKRRSGPRPVIRFLSLFVRTSAKMLEPTAYLLRTILCGSCDPRGAGSRGRRCVAGVVRCTRRTATQTRVATGYA